MRTTLRASGSRPAPFSVITTRALWTDPHVSEQMLRYHLDPTVDASSRRPEAIDAAVAWTTARFSIGPGTSVLDLGCGPGLYTIRWAAVGADVTGVDFSARSSAYARQAAERDGLRVRYVEADYLEWQADRTFDLVTMIMCDFSALGPTQRTALLESVGRWLAPNGAFLFDVEALPYLASRELGRRHVEHPDGGFWAGGPHTELAETIIYPEERVSLDRYTLSEAGRTWTIWNWLQAYDPASLTEVLRRARFTVDAVLADVTGRPYDRTAPEFAVVARSPCEPRRVLRRQTVLLSNPNPEGGLPMRNVTYSMGVSLDGYIVGPDGAFDWTSPDPEVFRFWIDEIREVGVHLMGRRLYETMLYWETADQDQSLDDSELEWTALWKPLPKVVFSTTLSAVQGNARLASGGLAEEIERLRAEPREGDIAIGGATLAAEAAELGLIDEYQAMVYPVLVGGGIPFFPRRERRVDLELVDTRTFSSGVVYLRYRVAR